MATNLNTTQRNTAWVIGGILVVALILGFIWMSTGERDLANMEPAAGEQQTEQPAPGYERESPDGGMMTPEEEPQTP